MDFLGTHAVLLLFEKNLITEEETSFPPLHGMALFGTCLQVMQKKGKFVPKMSLDIVDEKTVHSLFDEYRLDSISFELRSLKGYTDAEMNMNCSIAYVNEERVIRNLSSPESNSLTEAYQLPDYWKGILKEHNYRENIPAKIYQYMRLKNVPFLTSDLITSILKNTDRNSRRILSDMEQMGLIQSVTEEKNSGKPGRPRKIYELVIENG
ncbi:hypothetical protein [Jeotgalibacillus proteolyticus]|uniref:Uncharacterized protein n=1 Tax=Jeotgalibacillus proteolyticus TaxID=2082395 RepID=A0A2S5GFM1_9BACL|nr:hypothetical protein [Jeotgalibacillus proteolyticus]PPA71683.1 hypothetical protein C4B60_06410 [Jeotgalibacillus proteolyticus]